ncbi:MAG TPA: hypothetical protein VG871_20105 [Vicinamibacterales bacterium]|nr:hypothetical protein [Vicinamibacterales bacterium]
MTETGARFRLPHPVILLGAAVLLAAVLTWILPAGQYDRRDDPATGRHVVVAGTYHATPAAPVGPFAAAVAFPRGFIAAADVIVLVLLVGGAWVVVDRLGTLPAVVGWLVDRFERRGLVVIPIIAVFFGAMGALENMQEEIIPLVPVLMVLGAGIGVDAVTVVAMSLGAAAVGSAFGPTNPFQAGIALKLAQLPPLGRGGLRLTMLVAGLAVWIALTMMHAARHRRDVRLKPDSTTPAARRPGPTTPGFARVSSRHWLVMAIIVSPLAAYVYGALRLDWGLNELSGAFLAAGLVAGVVGGFGLTRTVTTYLDGMMSVLPAAAMVGVARSISLVLDDGRVVDTMLHALVTPLARVPAVAAVVLMIPVQALVHVPVPSVSGQAVLTMPLFVPIADLLAFSREAVVLAYQTGAGLCELVTPTNGALMAVLLAAGVSLQRWLRFAVVGVAALALLGLVAAAFAM